MDSQRTGQLWFDPREISWPMLAIAILLAQIAADDPCFRYHGRDCMLYFSCPSGYEAMQYRASGKRVCLKVAPQDRGVWAPRDPECKEGRVALIYPGTGTLACAVPEDVIPIR
jgi:hypothetical protein